MPGFKYFPRFFNFQSNSLCYNVNKGFNGKVNLQFN